ncbi:MAG: ABC transporter substrate-binding protein [Cycloclasticus sp.]|nr:ABC transporter substrate-binding protein [Cycloclasticus sp.]
MTKQTVTAALGHRYDTLYLHQQEVTLPDFTLEFPDVGEHPWVGFNRMVTSLPWDIGEQAFSHYLIAKDQGVPLTAIPAFPSRFFPQLGAVVSKQANIQTPKDLEGKRVGVIGFGYNPAVWLKHLLKNYHGVDIEKVIWVEDDEDLFLKGLNYPKDSRFMIERISEFTGLETAGTNPQVVAALDDGLLDAFFAPAAGPPLTDKTERLFSDPYPMLQEWLDAGGIMPINTLVTIRQETVKKFPELPQQLFDALKIARQRYHQEDALKDVHLGIETDFLFKNKLFPDQYGLEENLQPIEEMIKACYDQGVITRKYSPEDLFVSVS